MDVAVPEPSRAVARRPPRHVEFNDRHGQPDQSVVDDLPRAAADLPPQPSQPPAAALHPPLSDHYLR